MKALIFGNLTIDHNLINGLSITAPGGASFYTARTLSNLNVKTTIISPYGEDFLKKYLPKTIFFPKKALANKTLIFRNIYQDGKRKQTVDNIKNASLTSIQHIEANLLTDNDIVLITPILNNISPAEITKLISRSSSSLKVLLPQGFFRKKINKEIKTVSCNMPGNIFKLFDIIVVSEKDCQKIDYLAEKWGRNKTIAVITRGEKNATVYHQGRKNEYPSFNVNKIKDETGAGDIFTAAFAYAFFKSRKIDQAVNFAHSAAALSLPLLPKELKYGLEEVLGFAAYNGRNINI
ncbi:hypothetical protein A2W14_07435 [Candidatus Gottesmanbacteria bacterium RBG_16_37_8]|uniref:Carbohydrate kinase PfkB domain-containing protein n=1 Tax=Candidatus Gottesmanbacteria bacterium RBG_16_37_8 TaxID=1798371 RepID=A0A1F5YTF5_9BACT|nr:MAG: hypothetical protein A2W14_07435 [Candidatus Gottesmanbacteria bacterium RBG_16_37_8]